MLSTETMSDELKGRLRDIIRDTEHGPDHHQMVASILLSVLASLSMGEATLWQHMDINAKFSQRIINQLTASRN